MISPSYSMTATERVLPRLALNFTTATLDPRITFTRSGNTATVTNSSGVIVAVNADIPRFDYSPTTLVCRGLLIEESRTNVLLNSLLDGTSLATQSVVVTAAARTLSFYGTGEIVLSGAHSATVTGTGAYPTRTTLTFTPSAGTLTLTVTGTVQFAQLELGSFATSFIPTAASQVTRNADVTTMTGTNFSDWYNASEGTFVAWYSSFAAVSVAAKAIVATNDGSTSNRIYAFVSTSGRPTMLVSTLGAVQVNMTNDIISADSNAKTSMAYKVDSFAVASNGGSVTTDAVGTIPTVTKLDIGCFAAATNLNGHVQQLFYYPQRLLNAEARAFSK